MKNIYLIGFRGTSFQDPQYTQEPTLIRAGHVGIAFEDDLDLILGFHPTVEAIENIGGDEAAIEWLKENEPLEGCCTPISLSSCALLNSINAGRGQKSGN